MKIKTAHLQDVRSLGEHMKGTVHGMRMEAGELADAHHSAAAEELSAQLSDLDAEFNEQEAVLAEKVDRLKAEAAEWQARATAAESRLAGNGQEAKMKLDALRANNETAKLEMQTMEKQLDVARSTQHQAKVRVVALEAE